MPPSESSAHSVSRLTFHTPSILTADRTVRQWPQTRTGVSWARSSASARQTPQRLLSRT